MSKRILLVGCGELGSRHLQAVASLKDIRSIHVVDPCESSLEVGKLRLREVPELNRPMEWAWLKEPKKESADGDLCIIATQANGRCALIKQIARDLHYKNFLIEKIVAQSIEDYKDLISFCRQNNLNVWVNLKTRAYAIHQDIKSRLDPKEPVFLSDCGGNQGLANNGVHAADLFVFYDGGKEIQSVGNRIDSLLHPSKRAKDIFDLSGTLQGCSKKGSDFILSFAKGDVNPDVLSIISPKFRFIVDHFERTAWESSAETQWKWRSVPFEENVFVSHMTKKFASDIMAKGTCDLPTLQEAFPSHEFILSQLLPHFNRLMKTSNNHCPVT